MTRSDTRIPAGQPSSPRVAERNERAALQYLYEPGGPVEIAVGALSGIRIFTLFAGLSWPEGPVVRTMDRSTAAAGAQSMVRPPRAAPAWRLVPWLRRDGLLGCV